jgi:hypothetical protein
MPAVRVRLSPKHFNIDVYLLYKALILIKIKVIKSLRRIPWHSEAMKGVVTNEILRGAGNKF